MNLITSTQNKRIKFVKALQSKARLRRSESKLVLEGRRLIDDALQRGGKPELILYDPEHVDYHLIARLQNQRCTLLAVNSETLHYVSDTQQPQGILGVFHIPKPPLPKPPKPIERVLIIDGVREPGNMGSLLRTAAAAAVDLAILSPGCVDPYNSKALRAGMGAHFIVPVIEAPWSEIRRFCSDLTIYASRADAALSYADVDWTGAWALIVSSEAAGISAPARRLAQRAIAIPMAAAAESLNVAVAAGVLLFEAQRQRRHSRADRQ